MVGDHIDIVDLCTCPYAKFEFADRANFHALGDEGASNNLDPRATLGLRAEAHSQLLMQALELEAIDCSLGRLI